MATPKTATETVAALAGIGEAVVQMVRESGLLAKKRGRKPKAKQELKTDGTPKKKPGRKKKPKAQPLPVPVDQEEIPESEAGEEVDGLE